MRNYSSWCGYRWPRVPRVWKYFCAWCFTDNQILWLYASTKIISLSHDSPYFHLRFFVVEGFWDVVTFLCLQILSSRNFQPHGVLLTWDYSSWYVPLGLCTTTLCVHGIKGQLTSLPCLYNTLLWALTFYSSRVWLTGGLSTFELHNFQKEGRRRLC